MLTKYANVEAILEVKSSANRLPYEYGEENGSQLQRFAALREGRRTDDDYLYVRCRAISSRVNKNNDGWPSEELKKAYSTFVGRPIFVDHNNEDPKRTRGVIVDAQLHTEDDKTSSLDPYYSTAPENHKPPTWIELLMEIDAKTFPKLAEAIEKGDMDAVSMGANIDLSVCSVCANEATTPDEYCSHIKQKGMTFEITSDAGEKIKKRAYEDCFGVNFFEISNVFDPADDTADSWLDKAASIEKKAAAAGLDPEEVKAYLVLQGHKLPEAPSQDQKIEQPPSLAELVRTGKAMSQQRVAATKLADLTDQFIKPLHSPEQPKGDPNFTPQSEMVTAPQEVNTLRNEMLCPVCHAANMEVGADGISSCPVCGHVGEPEPLNNPDLSIAQETDSRQDVTDTRSEEGDLEIPATNPLDQVEFSPMSATNRETTSERISETMFTTKLKTSKREEADALVPVKMTQVKAKFGRGIHRGVYNAAKESKLNVRVSYPGVDGDVIEVPGKNGIFNLFYAEESAVKHRVPMQEVPIVVEGSEEDTQRFLEILNSDETHRRKRAEKAPVLPEKNKPSDEPTKEKIVQDENAPVEAKTAVVVEDGVVELDGTKYRLSPVEDKEEEKDDDKDSTVDEGLEKADALADEVGDEDESKDKDDEKESKLLAAFKLADLSVEMGLIEQEDKMAFIAEMEKETLPELSAREATLRRVKEAGLTQRTANKLPQLKRVPRLAHAIPSSLNGNSSLETPDEALFL